MSEARDNLFCKRCGNAHDESIICQETISNYISIGDISEIPALKKRITELEEQNKMMNSFIKNLVFESYELHSSAQKILQSVTGEKP